MTPDIRALLLMSIFVLGGVLLAVIQSTRPRQKLTPAESEKKRNALQSKLLPDETIIVALNGLIETIVMAERASADLFVGPVVLSPGRRLQEQSVKPGWGILAATDKRLVICQHSSRHNLRIIGYDTIRAIETKRDWRGESVTIIGDADIRIRQIQDPDEAIERFISHLHGRHTQHSPPEPLADIATQIQGLSKLNADGALTDAEFSAKKQELLKRL